MDSLKGKTAFVTGAASGIGLGMAEAFGHQGMNVMLADIEADALAVAVDQLAAKGVSAEGVELDVTDRAAVRDAAEQTVAEFGAVHVVCNNAGVAVAAPVSQIPEGDWDWIIDVNLKGIIHGVEAFLPHLEAHGEGGHIINTASMAGLMSTPTFEPYTATKYAVLGMSEGWAVQLAPRGIGVSVLCPGFVHSRILNSRRNRQVRYGPEPADREMIPDGVSAASVLVGVSPEVIGERVIEAVLGNELYILTHTEYEPVVVDRFNAILAAFDRAAHSPILAGKPVQGMPGVVTRGMGDPTSAASAR